MHLLMRYGRKFESEKSEREGAGHDSNLSKKIKSKSMHYLGENEDKNILNMR